MSNVNEDIKDKIIEIDLKIMALQKIRDKSNNPQGFDALISDLVQKKSRLLERG